MPLCIRLAGCERLSLVVVPVIPTSWDDSWFFMIHVHGALLAQLVVSQCHVIFADAYTVRGKCDLTGWYIFWATPYIAQIIYSWASKYYDGTSLNKSSYDGAIE
jgi:hypothetical protein